MRSAWEALSASEKRLVIIALILALLTLIWMAGIQPFKRYYQQLQQDVDDARWVQAQLQQNQMRLQRSTAVVANGENMHSVVIAALNQYQLDGEGTDSESKDDASVYLTLKNKPFDALMPMLGMLETQYGLQINALTLTPTSAGGLVDAQVTVTQ